MSQSKLKEIADKLRNEVSAKPKRMKIKTLMKCFGYDRRTEDSATRITEILSEIGVIIRPSIMKTDGEWKLKFDEQVHLSAREKEEGFKISESSATPGNWNLDGWFDNLGERVYRNEREVESKFLIPLLGRLGYTDNDRYDGMSLEKREGARKKTLHVDCALYNAEEKMLLEQPLLLAEAKRHFNKPKDLQEARDQVKSYAMWESCHFGLITDGRKLEVIDLFASIKGMKVIFECDQDTLKSNFEILYKMISKTSLTEFYRKFIEN